MANNNEAISSKELQRSWHTNSLPQKQFEDQVLEEMDHIWESDPQATGRTDKVWHINGGIRGGPLYAQAVVEVKAQWIEQGIWVDKWEYQNGPGPLDSWKHEGPLPIMFLDTPNEDKQGVRFRPKWKAEILRQYQASYPINQFLYQVKNESDRLTAQNDKNPTVTGDNINTKAYDIVRARWIGRHIWDEEWGTLPGMAWKHEKPVVDFTSGSESEAEADSFYSANRAAAEARREKKGARAGPALENTKIKRVKLDLDPNRGKGIAAGLRSAKPRGKAMKTKAARQRHVRAAR